MVYHLYTIYNSSASLVQFNFDLNFTMLLQNLHQIDSKFSHNFQSTFRTCPGHNRIKTTTNSTNQIYEFKLQSPSIADLIFLAIKSSKISINTIIYTSKRILNEFQQQNTSNTHKNSDIIWRVHIVI